MAVGLVGQNEIQRRQKKGPEPPFFLLGTIEISPFQHADEELLREILGLVRRISDEFGVHRSESMDEPRRLARQSRFHPDRPRPDGMPVRSYRGSRATPS